MTADELNSWRRGRLTVPEARALFAGLDPLPCEAMLGEWIGVGLPTGHPLDGLLESYGWRGKRFQSLDAVDPLLFRQGENVCAIAPSRLPYGLVTRPPAIARARWARAVFRLALPLLSTNRPAARLRTLIHGDRASAAMVYDALPIIDHFRSINSDRVLGLMDYRDMPTPYFFLLTRVPPAPARAPTRRGEDLSSGRGLRRRPGRPVV